MERKEGAFAGKERTDYRKILPPEQFDKFALYRQCRKEIAEVDSIPPYLVFVDEQLAEMAKLESLTPECLKGIKGIGTGKFERFGERFLNMVAAKKCLGSETANRDGMANVSASNTSGEV